MAETSAVTARVRRCGVFLLTAAMLLLAFSSVATAAGPGRWGAQSWRLAGTRSADRGLDLRRADGTVRPASASVETGTIEGTVTDAVTKAGVEGIEVCALQLVAGEEEPTEPCAPSGPGGGYQLTGLPVGEYVVGFFTPSGSTLNYVTQYYNGVPRFAEATRITVTAGGIFVANAAMVHGGRIEGKVTAAAGEAAIEGIEVCAFGVGSVAGSGACAETNGHGEYVVTGLATGKYKVGFRSPPGSSLDYLTQYYNGVSTRAAATEVAVTDEMTTGAIDAAMQLGGEIKGFVTSAATGKPLTAVVCALTTAEVVVSCVLTKANGEYLLAALPEGHYKVEYENPDYQLEYYKDVTSFAAANALAITPGAVLESIDAAMHSLLPQRISFPTISGTIAVGSALSCSPGEWEGAPPLSFAYNWVRTVNGVATLIEGATTPTYTIQSADVGSFVACRVTVTNSYTTGTGPWAQSIGYRVPAPVTGPTQGGAAQAAQAGGPAAGGVLSTTIVLPAVSVARRVHASRRSATVRLSCKAGACHGTLTLLLQVVTRHGHHTHTSAVVLATGSFSIAAGKSATATLRLTSAGRSRLANAKRHVVKALLKVALHGRAPSTYAVTVD